MTQTPNPPAGWYPQGDQERWWDGTAWSDNFRPLGNDSSGGYPPMFQAMQQPQPGQQAGYGQPQQPGYAQPGGYQQPYYAAPRQKSNTVRNLLITFAVLAVLLVGGCTAMVALLAKNVDDVVNDDTPGGPNNPLTITAGQGFEVAGFTYADGWSVAPDEVGDTDVVGLTVTNDRDSSDYAFVTIKLLDVNTVVATVSCTGAGDRIAPGTTETLDCTSSDDLPVTYDEITIQDAF